MTHFFRFVLLSSILGMSLPSWAVGEWQVYQNYANYSALEVLDNHAYVLSGNHIFYSPIDSASAMATPISRLEGLSGSLVHSIAVSDEEHTLAVVYTDGNIDLISSDGFIANIPDLKNKTILGDKSIIHTQAQNSRLFISTGFGFLVVDLKNKTIADSFMLNTAVQCAFSLGQTYYYASTSGLYACHKQQAPYNPTSWQKVADYAITEVVDSKTDTETVWLQTTDRRILQITEAGNIHELQQLSGSRLLGNNTSHLMLLRADKPILCQLSDNSISEVVTPPYTDACDFTLTSDSTLLFLLPASGLAAAQFTGISQDIVNCTPIYDGIGLQQTGSGSMSNMIFAHGILAAVPGGDMTRLGYGGIFNTPGVLSQLDTDGTWYNLTQADVKQQMPTSQALFKGLVSIAASPLVPQRYYVGSIAYGLFVIENGEVVEQYDHTNTDGGISSIVENEYYDRITALDIDDDGNIWMANSAVTPVLRCLTTEGKWIKYPNKTFDGASHVPHLLIARHDPYALKWLLRNYPYQKSQVAIYYDNGTPHTPADDQAVSFSTLTDQDGNTISPDYMNDLAEDHNGAIWLLTTSGPFVIDSQVDAFNHPGQVRRIKIPRNDGTNLADYLMAGVDTRCIAIDAANRKWIGTAGNGAYLISADGLQQLAHFTTSNSPLLSDDILDIVTDPETGTVFFSTEGGIVAYASDAIAGSKDYSKVYCYPNPVRPEFNGNLHICGLMDQSQVRITDINNHVVYSTRSQGGMVSWDLCNIQGNRIKTGVYLVYGIDADGKDGCVTKFLVVE